MISHKAGSSPLLPNEGRGDAETDCLDIFQIAQCSPSRPGPSPRDSCTQGTLFTEISTSLCKCIYSTITSSSQIFWRCPSPSPLHRRTLLCLKKEQRTRSPPEQYPCSLDRYLRENLRLLKL